MRTTLIAATTVALLVTTVAADAAPARRRDRTRVLPSPPVERTLRDRSPPGVITSSTPNASGNFGGPGTGGGNGSP